LGERLGSATPPAFAPKADYDRLTIASPIDDRCMPTGYAPAPGLLTAAEVAALDTIAGKVIAQFAGEVPAELPPLGVREWPARVTVPYVPGRVVVTLPG
jgi:hypothetical protein